MILWGDTDDKTKCGVVLAAFEGKNPQHLNLCIGDVVLLHKHCPGWYYGCNVRSQKQYGIFPKSYVHVKPVSITQSGKVSLVVAKELHIVNEMTAVLREWGKIWKRLYVKHRAPDSEDENKFKDLRLNILALIEGRKEFLSRKLTVDELKAAQQKYSQIIDIGNAKLGLDLVVRDEAANTLDPDTTSTIKLFRQHEVSAKRIARMLKGKSGDVGETLSTSFNLWVNLKAFVCNVTEPSEVLVSLYDASRHSFFTESYVCKYADKGLPRDLEMLNQTKVIFTDLGAKDLAREKIFIICQVIRVGRMLLNEHDNKKESHDLRRPFGIAACDITDIIKSMASKEQPTVAPFVPCGEKESLESVIRKAVAGKDNSRDQGLHLVVRRYNEDLRKLKKENAALVAPPTAVARKLGFPDVILPDDFRNDLYVTLEQGDFKKGNKLADKNVDVTMSVCNQHGKPLERVIYEGVGGEMVSEYRSVIYYHEDKPKWCETVKVGIPLNECYGSHLKFIFKHRSSNDSKDKSEKPFALAYMRLMHENGTVSPDGTHNLLVYRIDKKGDDTPAYLKLPSKQQDIENRPMIGQSGPSLSSSKQPPIQAGAYSCNMADSFQIHTLICSTKLTSNVELTGLMKWRHNPKQLQQVLMAFMRVDGDEIVKFLPDVLDALFNIFMENSESDTYDSAVFSALIHVLGLVSDVKYHQFRSVLDLYIRENYSATLAYNKLIVVLREQLETIHDLTKLDGLMKTMTSLQYILRFINGSRRLFARLNEQRGKQAFETAMKQVFNAMCALLSKTSPKLVTAQLICLRQLPGVISDIITVFTPSELSSVLMEMIRKVPAGQITCDRLKFMSDIVQSDLFKLPDCRHNMLPTITQQLTVLLHRREHLELCYNVVAELMDSLHTEGNADDITIVSRQMLRTMLQSIAHMMSPHSQALSTAVAAHIALLRQMSDKHYQQYLSSFDTSIDLQDFLMEILMSFNHMINKGVFPRDWSEMILLQNSVFLKALRQFSVVIKERFVQNFEFQILDTFFQCAVTFIGQEALELHKFSTAKRNKIINRYGDMRRGAASEVQAMWYSLDSNKVQFIPHLVELFLQMTLIPDTELRRGTLRLFYDMMHCEFLCQAASRISAHSSFFKFEKELITKLNKLIAEEGRGDPEYRQLFHSILQQACEEGDMRMRREGLAFTETVRDLLLLLLEYRDVIGSENADSKMSCTVGLLNFYDRISRRELYVVYLHKLVDLHLACDNFTEAAFTKKLYADLLKWSDNEITMSLLSPADQLAARDGLTHRELKMKVYYEIIDCLDRGKMWEQGIQFCKELAVELETQLFDYVALGKILKRQSEFYMQIMGPLRHKTEYFRVAYYGTGFPFFQQNKEFVVRGKELDKLSDLTIRLQNLYPNANILGTLNPLTEEQKSSSEQYLQVNSVTPVLKLKEHLRDSDLHENIISYYRTNEVDRFVYTKRKNESPTDLTTQWFEKVYLTISQPLPGILRWFPVISTHVVEVSPLESALENMTSANTRIRQKVDEFTRDPERTDINQLSMLLSGIVDAAVNGGISKYKSFYSDEYLDRHMEHMQFVDQLKEATSLQLMLLYVGLEIHRAYAPEILAPLQTHLEKCFAQMKSSIEQDYGITATTESQYMLAKRNQIDLKRIKALQPRHHDSPSRMQSKPASASTQRSQSMLTAKQTQEPRARPDGRTKVFTRTGTTMTSKHGSARGSTVSTTSQQSNTSEGPATPSPASSPSLGAPRSRRPSPSPSRATVLGEGSVIELSEELTPHRPPRPSSHRSTDSRPSSGQYLQQQTGGQHDGSSLSLASSVSSTMSSSSVNRLSADFGGVGGGGGEAHDAVPPPLPSKHSVSVVVPQTRAAPEKQGPVEPDNSPHTPPVLPSKKHSNYVEVSFSPKLPGKQSTVVMGTSPPSKPQLPGKQEARGVPEIPGKSARNKPALVINVNSGGTSGAAPFLPPKSSTTHPTSDGGDSSPVLPPRSPYTPKTPVPPPTKPKPTKKSPVGGASAVVGQRGGESDSEGEVSPPGSGGTLTKRNAGRGLFGVERPDDEEPTTPTNER